jgi:hypothetical protein
LAGVAYSGWKMQQIDREYSVLLNSRAASQIDMARASRNISAMALYAYKVVYYDGATAISQAAVK